MSLSKDEMRLHEIGSVSEMRRKFSFLVIKISCMKLLWIFLISYTTENLMFFSILCSVPKF